MASTLENALRLVKPGEMVVSITDILNQLGNKITDAEKQQLLIAMLSPRREYVQPGDLITSDLMSQILVDIADLQVAVATLQSATATTSKTPVLISRDPTGDVEVGSKLTLLGVKLRAAGLPNTVMLGSVAITAFLAEDDTHISFQVPDSFTGLPRNMSVFVSNAGGGSSQSLAVRVLPKSSVQGGKAVILDQTAALGEINIGTTYDLKWLIDSQTLLPVSYKWSLEFTNLVGTATAQSWKNATVFDPAGPIEIVAGSPLLVKASVTIPTGASMADVSLLVENTSETYSINSNPLHLEVGQTAEVSDARALFSVKTIPPFNPDKPEPNSVRAANIALPDGTSPVGVQVKYGATGKIPCNMHVTSDGTAAGIYAYSVQIETPGTRWATPTVTPATSGQTVNSDSAITVTVTNTDASNSNAVTYLVVKAAHTPTGSTTVNFVSFIRIPIQGANF